MEELTAPPHSLAGFGGGMRIGKSKRARMVKGTERERKGKKREGNGSKQVK